MTDEPTQPERDERDYDDTWKIGDETMRLARGDVDEQPNDQQAQR